jgi:hypothetical protein
MRAGSLATVGVAILLAACAPVRPDASEIEAAAVTACGTGGSFSQRDPCHTGFVSGALNADSGTRDISAEDACSSERPADATDKDWTGTCERAFASGEAWYDARWDANA